MYVVFFFNDTATTEIYTLSLHDALPISRTPLTVAAISSRENFDAFKQSVEVCPRRARGRSRRLDGAGRYVRPLRDRKSTRLNSSHANISYAVFCLKKKKLH